MIYHLLAELENFSEIRGGAISRWTANVLRSGDEVIICPDFDDSWRFPRERIYRMPNWSRTHPVHPLLYRLPWPLQKAIYLRIFEPLFQRLNPGDVIYVHNAPESASVLASTADRLGVKVVLHMHNSHLVHANGGQLAALKKWPIVFCSDFLRREVAQALPGHFQTTHIVYNGADQALFRARNYVSNSVPTIVFTGRLSPPKGVHVLLQAMRILDQKGITAQCKIVGRTYFANNRTTRYSRYLARICPPNTEMVGYKSGQDLAELLRTSDIFCCPSIWNDPFPLAPLEAMATGLPVVASKAGGLPEALAHGGGILVQPGDPEELAQVLEALIRDAAYRNELSAAASDAFRRHFLWSSVRTQYEKVIESLNERAVWDESPQSLTRG